MRGNKKRFLRRTQPAHITSGQAQSRKVVVERMLSQAENVLRKMSKDHEPILRKARFACGCMQVFVILMVMIVGILAHGDMVKNTKENYVPKKQCGRSEVTTFRGDFSESALATLVGQFVLL